MRRPTASARRDADQPDAAARESAPRGDRAGDAVVDPRREPAEAAASAVARELQRDLELIRVGLRPVFDTWLPSLRTALGARVAIAYRLARNEAGASLRALYTDGLGPAEHRLVEAFLQRPTQRLTFDPRRPEAEQRNVPLRLDSLLSREALRSLPVARDLLEPLGLLDEDVVRVLVCEGDRLLCWVGVARPAPFTPAELDLLAQLIEPLRRRMVLEDRLAEVLLPTSPLEEALVTAEPVSSRARAQATLAPEYSVEESGVFACVDDADLAIATSQRRKVQLERANDAWRLTPRQRQVLELVVTGMSNKDIARALDCAVRTAELHVTLLLQKAGCESRTELMSRFFSSF